MSQILKSTFQPNFRPQTFRLTFSADFFFVGRIFFTADFFLADLFQPTFFGRPFFRPTFFHRLFRPTLFCRLFSADFFFGLTFFGRPFFSANFSPALGDQDPICKGRNRMRMHLGSPYGTQGIDCKKSSTQCTIYCYLHMYVVDNTKLFFHIQ